MKKRTKNILRQALAGTTNGTQNIMPSVRRRDTTVSRLIPRSISRTRKDISNWQMALRQADSVENPRRTALIRLYDDILLDAHLSSQWELRRGQTLSTPFSIYQGDEINDDLTRALASMTSVADLNRDILDARAFGHSVVELSTDNEGRLAETLIPRTHVVPEKGYILIQESDTKGIAYRDTKEYGMWILEFGARHDYGLLNKAVPHVLFKKFAEACWSELCEIYGVPPRYLKTDTSDPAMLRRGEEMMRAMGSAAWFILDREEEFQFAQGVSTNGDVYSNLISLCNNEMSLLISGAVVGQDTVNGNRSKEEVGVTLTEKLVQSDRRYLERAWNDTVIPAFVRLGILPQGCRFAFQQEEDTNTLFQMCVQLLPYKDIDDQYIRDKFGIEVTGTKSSGAMLSAEGDNRFFD